MPVKYFWMVRWHFANQPVISISLIEHVRCCTKTLNSVELINKRAPQVYLCIPFRPSNSWSGPIAARAKRSTCDDDIIHTHSRVGSNPMWGAGTGGWCGVNAIKWRCDGRRRVWDKEQREENNININRMKRSHRGENARARLSETDTH